jgi:hypothetical protein
MLRGRLESNPNRLAIIEIIRLSAGPPAPVRSLTFHAPTFSRSRVDPARVVIKRLAARALSDLEETLARLAC